MGVFDTVKKVVVMGATGAELYDLAARTAEPSQTLQTNPGAKGLYLIVYVTAKSGSPSLVPQLYILPPTATVGNENPVQVIWMATIPITASGVYVYLLYPGAEDWIHLSYPGITEMQSISLPRKWKIGMSHANSDSITYQVFSEYLF
jgi:hypothetical protein